MELEIYMEYVIHERLKKIRFEFGVKVSTESS
jgi:hypothetical protein